MIRVMTVGRIVKEPKVFSYGEGKTGVGFTIASNEYGFDEPTFIDCTAFGKDENFAKYLLIGNQVIITGRLSKNKEGYWSIIVDDFEFGAKKQS